MTTDARASRWEELEADAPFVSWLTRHYGSRENWESEYFGTIFGLWDAYKAGRESHAD